MIKLNISACLIASIIGLIPFCSYAEQKPKVKPKIVKITDDGEHQNQDKQNIQPNEKKVLSDEEKATQKTIKVVDDGNGGMAIEIVAEPATSSPQSPATLTGEILKNTHNSGNQAPKPVAIDSMPLPALQNDSPLISPINKPAKDKPVKNVPLTGKTESDINGKTFIIDATKPADKIILTPEPVTEIKATETTPVVRKTKPEPKKSIAIIPDQPAVEEKAPPPTESPLIPKVTKNATSAKIEPVTVRPLTPPKVEPAKPVTPSHENMQRKANIISNQNITRSILTSGIRDLEPIDSIVLLNKGKNGKLYYFTELNNLHDQKITHKWIQGEKILAEKTLYVNGNYWRAWSSVVVNGNEDLRIEVLDSNGKVMSSQEIKVN